MATTTSGTTSYDEKQYWTNRDFKTSARLSMQHWMWQLQLGYALHPSIPESIRDDPNLKIADVACGNGAWLFELRAPSTTQLDGYDLSPNCFGTKEWLPKNVKLVGGFDALAPGNLPEDVKGVYDVVHVRAFASIPKGNNVGPFVETLKAMLKPGGFLQWEESHPGKLSARVPDGSNISSAATSGLIQVLAGGAKQSNLIFDWITDIKSILQSQGFGVVSYQDVDWRSEFQRGWNDNLLTVYEELAQNFPLEKDAPPGFPLPREKYNAMFAGVLHECENGVWLHQPAWSLLARKQ